MPLPPPKQTHPGKIKAKAAARLKKVASGLDGVKLYGSARGGRPSGSNPAGASGYGRGPGGMGC